MENIQSLSICCPSATGKCINHCETCTARQHTNPYENKYHGKHNLTLEYWNDVIKRMRYAQSKGCTTVMLTGSNEPQQDRRWLEGLYLAMKNLDKPFDNIEIQTTGAFLNWDYLEFLHNFGVTTIALSTFNLWYNKLNREIEHNADKKLDINYLCSDIKLLGMNLRLCINVTDYCGFDEITCDNDVHRTVEGIFLVCKRLGADQVTFRKMWSNKGTPEADWIDTHTIWSDKILDRVKSLVTEEGKSLGKLPYGATKYDMYGFSIVIDTDSMAKDVDNSATKYYIIRENGKLYDSWDSPASLIF